MEPSPELSIVIVAHNGRERVLQTVASALAAATDVDLELLLVDSGSTDGTADAGERLGDPVRVIRSVNRGFAAGSNRALRDARGRYVLLLNPDVDIAHGSFRELLTALDQRPTVGAASVIQRSPTGYLLNTIRRFPSPMQDMGEAVFAQRWPIVGHLQSTVVDESEYEHEKAVDWVVGAFLIMRREALIEVGLLDERFFLYSEETDWCLRLRQKGWDARHLPVMTIVHHEGGYERSELVAQLSHSKVLFAQKHRGTVEVFLTRLALALRHGIRILLWLAPAATRSGSRVRLGGELRALAVVLKLARPPFPNS